MPKFSILWSQTENNWDRKFYHLQASADSVLDLFLKYSMQCHTPGHHGSDNMVQGLTEHRISERQSLTKKSVKQQDGVSSAASMTKDRTAYIAVRTVKLLCVSTGVSRLTIQGKITEAMQQTPLLYTIRMEVPFQVSLIHNKKYISYFTSKFRHCANCLSKI
jgi:hypothetical protein